MPHMSVYSGANLAILYNSSLVFKSSGSQHKGGGPTKGYWINPRHQMIKEEKHKGILHTRVFQGCQRAQSEH